jgi:hypothetical protein
MSRLLTFVLALIAVGISRALSAPLYDPAAVLPVHNTICPTRHFESGEFSAPRRTIHACSHGESATGPCD